MTLEGQLRLNKIDLIIRQYVLEQKNDSILVDEIRINAFRGIDFAFEASETITIEDPEQFQRAAYENASD